jgi:HEAT repeat protein
LERVLITQRKLAAAIEVLEDLVRIDPLRAREYYQRLSGYATELYQDDRAFSYATRVVELAPDDAESHRKLAEVHRRRQDSKKAIESLRIAIRKNDRLFPAYIELADLLINSNELAEADTLLRHVMRLSPDDEVVARASRTCIQINLGRRTLESLEEDLLPLSVANPRRPVFRRMLLEMYRAIALSLPANEDPDYGEALAKIEQIGRRAVGPLLDALADEDESQQRAAIDLLTRIQNKHATPALMTYATSSTADPSRRARALLAIGSVNDPQALPLLETFLLSDPALQADEGDPVIASAVWAIAKQQSRESARLLQRILVSPIAQSSGTIKALCALGLGAARDQRSSGALWGLALDDDELQLVRVAALQALADLGSTTQAERAVKLADLGDPTLRAVALLALARMGAPSIESWIARDLFSPNAEVERAAWAAALITITKRYDAPRALFSIPQAQVDVRAMLQATVPTAFAPDDRARTLEDLSPAISKAAQEAVGGPTERALQVVLRLSSAPGNLQLEQASPALRERGEQVIEGIKQSLVLPIAKLVQHPTRRVQLAALNFLIDREEPAAREAILGALNGRDQQLSQATLQAVAHTPSALHDVNVAESVAHLLKEPAPWPLRVKAAETLALVGPAAAEKAPGGSTARTLLIALENAALRDGYALVRQSALQALKAIGGSAARPTLNRAAATDPEGKVRAVARDLLGEGSATSP